MQVKVITLAAIVGFGLFDFLGISTPVRASPVGTFTVLSLTTSLSPVDVGDPVTFTATLTGLAGFPNPGPVPNESIDFKNLTLGTDLGSANTNLSGSATLTVSFASAGIFDIEASFVGDALFLASTGHTDETILPVATPLPATLPLFATGIGGLGLLGWRRKWKAVA
jgi:hypothetical protein